MMNNGDGGLWWYCCQGHLLGETSPGGVVSLKMGRGSKRNEDTAVLFLYYIIIILLCQEILTILFQ